MFCSKCGKELPNGVKFCPECGQQIGGTIIHKEENDNDISMRKQKQQENKPSGCLIAIIVSILLFFILTIVGSNSDTSSTSDNNKASCPTVAEMEDAIRQYQSVGIIQKYTPALNTVYISTSTQNNMNIDDLRVLGYITACYSAHIKGNDLIWADIYNYNTGKKIAKYSESYGFKMY